MRHYRFRALTLFLTSWFLSAPAPATEKLEAIDVEYKRDRIGLTAAGRPSVSKPAAGALPRGLAIERANGPEQRDDVESDPDLETRASVAATWTARQKIDVFGRREIHRAGFFDGLHAAFRDPLIGDWDHRHGVRAGSRDPDAYRIGTDLGFESAKRVSGEIAHDLITTSFRDQSRQTHAQAGPATPAFEAQVPAARQPRVLDVFDQLPQKSFLQQAEIRPLPDAWRLYQSDNYDDFYDRSWTDPASAFEYWLDHHRDHAFWRDLEGADRSRFEDVFRWAFRHQLPELLAGAGERAYAQGHDEGWSYGVAVVQEWRYREGYTRGFEIALHDHAESAFRDHYPSLLAERYDELLLEPSGSGGTAPRGSGPAPSAEPMEGLMPQARCRPFMTRDSAMR